MKLRCVMLRGDCFNWMPKLPGDSVQLCCADLPFGVTGFTWDKRLDLTRLRSEVTRLMCGGGPLVAMASEKFMLDLCAHWRSLHRYSLVWDKAYSVGAFHAARRPMVSHEYVVVFGKTPTYNPQKTFGHKAVKKTGETMLTDFTPGLKANRAGRRLDLDASRHPGSILRFPRDKRQRRSAKNISKTSTHPSQKPVALLSWLVRSYSNPGDHVFDPVSGSATTAVAALLSGRHVTCIEKDPEHYAAGVQRVKQTIESHGIDVELRLSQ